MNGVIIRHATADDIPRMLEIFAAAREFMVKTGNPNQWGEDYPGERQLIEDMECGSSYVVDDGGHTTATFVIRENPEPAYSDIKDGHWLNSEPYATIHRVASTGETRGIFRLALQQAMLHHDNIRIDTHCDNVVMRNAISKAGFEYCGIINYGPGNERMAFQLVVH